MSSISNIFFKFLKSIEFILFFIVITLSGCGLAPNGPSILFGGVGKMGGKENILQANDLDGNFNDAIVGTFGNLLEFSAANITKEEKEKNLNLIYDYYNKETGLNRYGDLIIKLDLFKAEYDKMQFESCPVSSLYVLMQKKSLSKFDFKNILLKYNQAFDLYKNEKQKTYDMLNSSVEQKIHAINSFAEKFDILSRYGHLNKIFLLSVSHKDTDIQEFYKAKSLDIKKYSRDYLRENLKILQRMSDLAERLPIMMPMPGAKIYRQFGPRINPINFLQENYLGIDFKGEEKSKVYATGKGKIIHAGIYQNLGNTIIIDHGGDIKSIYARLQLPLLVNVGDHVNVMTPIGTQGMSGSDANNQALFYQILLDDKPVDPLIFITKGTQCNY